MSDEQTNDEQTTATEQAAPTSDSTVTTAPESPTAEDTLAQLTVEIEGLRNELATVTSQRDAFLRELAIKPSSPTTVPLGVVNAIAAKFQKLAATSSAFSVEEIRNFQLIIDAARQNAGA